MKKRLAVFFVSFAVSLCVAHADMVPIYQKVSVTGQDSVCKAVTNNSDTGLGLFVPTQTVDEWQTFYNNTPTGIQLSLCTCQAQTVNNCSLSETTYGGTNSGTCAAGFSGACSYSCTSGVLTQVTNSCVKNCSATTVNYCSLPTTTSGSTAGGTCSGGASGACSYSCSNGTFSPVSPCKRDCPSQIVNNCVLSATINGGSSGSCLSGYSGSCNYKCTDGSWSQASNSCYANPPPPPPVPPNNLCSAQSSCAVHCTTMGFDYSECTSPFSFAGKTWNCMCGKYSDATILGLGFCSGCQ
jgi:hypothetical protein